MALVVNKHGDGYETRDGAVIEPHDESRNEYDEMRHYVRMLARRATLGRALVELSVIGIFTRRQAIDALKKLNSTAQF